MVQSHEAHVAQNNAVTIGNHITQGKWSETIHENICKMFWVCIYDSVYDGRNLSWEFLL